MDEVREMGMNLRKAFGNMRMSSLQVQSLTVVTLAHFSHVSHSFDTLVTSVTYRGNSHE